MTDLMLRERILYLYVMGVSFRKIAWLLDIRIDDVKRTVSDYKEGLKI